MSSSRNLPRFADGSWMDVDGNGNLVIYSKTGATLLSINNQGTIIGGTNSRFAQDSNGLPVKSNAISLAGQGFPLIVAVTPEKSESATDAALLTFPSSGNAPAGTYRVSLFLAASASAAGNIGWAVAYTDSNGHAQSVAAQILQTYGVTGSPLTRTLSVNDNVSGIPYVFDVDGSAPITVGITLNSGTFTAKVTAVLERII